MAAKLKDVKGQKYKLSYKNGHGDTQELLVIAGKVLVRQLEHSQLVTGSVTAKNGDRFYALFELQKDTALQIWTLMGKSVRSIRFPEAIEKFKVDCKIHNGKEDLYVIDPHDLATGKQWFLKSRTNFVNNNTLG